MLREKESLRAMNEALQVQVQNLKHERELHEENNRQKHELIEREIKERKHLMDELQSKEEKCLRHRAELQ